MIRKTHSRQVWQPLKMKHQTGRERSACEWSIREASHNICDGAGFWMYARADDQPVNENIGR